MGRLLPLLTIIFLFSFFSHASSAQITFNTTAISQCYPTNETLGCSFNDPSIWNGNVTPSTADLVVVISNDTNLIVLLYDNETIALSSLVLSGLVELQINSPGTGLFNYHNLQILLSLNNSRKK